MSRLLFAAARGARVQYGHDKGWLRTYYVSLAKTGLPYRIHPKDKHLQYGPISTALRKWAIEDAAYAPPIGEFAIACLQDGEGTLPGPAEHAKTFALFVAEALADEGM